MGYMLVEYTTTITIDDFQKLQLPAITHSNPVGISKDGLVALDKADIILKVDSHDELVVVKAGENLVKLERFGRFIQLKPDHPVRISENDCFFIDDASICISKLSALALNPSRISHLFQKTNRFLASSSIALCSLVTFSACMGADPGCEIGQMRCYENKVLRCVETDSYYNKMEEVEDCGDKVCKIMDNAASCVAEKTNDAESLSEQDCVDGKMKCLDNAVYACRDKEWLKNKDCENGASCLESE